MLLSFLIFQVVINSNIIRAQQTFYSSSFSSSSTYYYQDDTLVCTNNADCYVSCGSTYTCRNTTIYCPTSDNICSVSCSGTNSCWYTDIHWVQGNQNSLSNCDSDDCKRVHYPPPESDDTQLLINCDGSYECAYQTITCPDNAICQVLCTESYSCGYSIIHCPSTSLCHVGCTGSNACYQAVVHWSYDPSATSSLACPDQGNQCDLIQSPTIINPPNNNNIYNLICKDNKECASATINCPSNGHCIINCVGYASCSGSIINCPSNAPCQVICTDSYSCYRSTINGPPNNVFIVLCDGSYSCYGLTIHAEETEYFYFTVPVYDSWTTAANTTIYYPPRDIESNQTRAKVYLDSTYSFNGYYGYEPQQFYALNGWNDIDIIYSTASWSMHGGRMYCGYNCADSCKFDSSSYSCNSVNTICDDAFVTPSPTTADPTTAFPTTNPTTPSPTNSQPTQSTMHVLLDIKEQLEYSSSSMNGSTSNTIRYEIEQIQSDIFDIKMMIEPPTSMPTNDPTDSPTQEPTAAPTLSMFNPFYK